MTKEDKKVVEFLLKYGVAYVVIAFLTFGFVFNEGEDWYKRCVDQNPGKEWNCSYTYHDQPTHFAKSVFWPIYVGGRVSIWIMS